MQINGTGPFFVFLSVVTSIVALLTTIFWIVVGWRAMRAHEQIAEALREQRFGQPADALREQKPV
ncbi:MAG: hypothetical protein IPJ77_14020 [Planctomycetes bacterium]|nr:hypothetical protein [Planctomycetota bacterium]